MIAETAPIQAPGVFNRVGAWLGELPDVPNWMNWGIVVITLATPLIVFVWRFWGADWFARRSKITADKRAKALTDEVIKNYQQSKNLSYIIMESTKAIASVVIVCAGAVILTTLTTFDLYSHSLQMTLGGPYSRIEEVVWWFYLIISYLMVWGSGRSFSRTRRLAFPDRFEKESRPRIKALLIKAGKSPEDLQEIERELHNRIEATTR